MPTEPAGPDNLRITWFAVCGKGWDRRCGEARGATCRCKCGGKNHGAIRHYKDAKSTLDTLWPMTDPAKEPS